MKWLQADKLSDKAALETIKQKTLKELEENGKTLDPLIYQKALDKAKRWMSNAYGRVNYDEFVGETGGSIYYYYLETLGAPTGMGTSNRENYQSRVRDIGREPK